MAELDIQRKLDRLSEAVVLADASDLRALADLHSMFEDLEGAVGERLCHEEVSAAVTAGAKLIQEIILGDKEAEGADSERLLEVLGQTLSALQSVLRDGRSLEDVSFPSELETERESNGNEQKTGSEPEDLPVEEDAGASLSMQTDDRILVEFLERQAGVLSDMEALVLSLENSDNESDLGALRQLIHTLKGEAGLLGLSDVENLCHQTENILSAPPSGAVVEFLLETKDWLARAFESDLRKAPKPPPVEQLLSRRPRCEEGDGREAVSESESEGAPGGDSTETSTEKGVAVAGDAELIREFITEATEHLGNAEIHLLTLEVQPEEEEALNAVFRAFHTIKGVAGFLALSDIERLSHCAEDLLDHARKGDLLLSGSAIDASFEAVDGLKRQIENLCKALDVGGAPEKDASLAPLLDRIKRVLSGHSEQDTEDSAVGVAPGKKLGEILVESGRVTRESVQQALKEQEKPPENKKLGELLVESAASSSARIKEGLDKQKENAEAGKLGEILVESGSVDHDDVERALRKQQNPPSKRKLGEILVRGNQVEASDVAKALRGQRRKQSRATSREGLQVREAIRVDADRLDHLVDLIGELVIAESMVGQAKVLENVTKSSPEFAGKLSQLDKITRELQEIGTSLRMVPIRPTFQKMARLVRDLSKKAGKRIEFSMSGEETELDKTVVDNIGDPLVHMVRNAVDHGIEGTRQARLKAGKAAEGKVSLRAYHRGGSIFVEVEDDGRGLDRESILSKAREKGLVSNGEAMSDSEVYNLIFEPGFSTAKKVTDVSGRGVGMDVVRKNVQALRGQVDIKSSLGLGSVFRIRLPLTLAIIDGMVITVGRERYIVPTLSVVKLIRPEDRDLNTILESREMLSMYGKLIPLIRLGELFSIADAEQDATRGLILVVEDEGVQAALLANSVLGQQQVVIKSLGKGIGKVRGLSGGAIMPDGRVGLILDVSGFVRLANSEEVEE